MFGTGVAAYMHGNDPTVWVQSAAMQEFIAPFFCLRRELEIVSRLVRRMIPVKTSLKHGSAQPMIVVKDEIEIAERMDAGFYLAGELQKRDVMLHIAETSTTHRQSDLCRHGQLRTPRSEDDDVIIGVRSQVGDIERFDDNVAEREPRIEKKCRSTTSGSQPRSRQAAHLAFQQEQSLRTQLQHIRTACRSAVARACGCRTREHGQCRVAVIAKAFHVDGGAKKLSPGYITGH